MGYYSGAAPGESAYVPGAVIANKGLWETDILVADDGDTRDAALAMAAAEGALDRTNWLGFHKVDGYKNNTSLDPYSANIWWSGAHVFEGTANFEDFVLFGEDVAFSPGTVVTVNGALQILGSISGNVTLAGSLAVTVNQTIGGTLTVTGASTFGNQTVGGTQTVTGAATFNGAVTCSGAATFNGAVTCNNTTTFTKKTVHSGVDAYNVLRVSSGPDSGSAGSETQVDMWKADAWRATLTAERGWKMMTPGAEAFRTSVILTSSTHPLHLVNQIGVEIITLNSTVRSADLLWDGANWYVEASYKP